MISYLCSTTKLNSLSYEIRYDNNKKECFCYHITLCMCVLKLVSVFFILLFELVLYLRWLDFDQLYVDFHLLILDMLKESNFFMSN